MTYINTMRAADSPSIDAFSRWRTSDPVTLFESTFRYDLAPLQYEAVLSSGTVIHYPTDSYAGLATSNLGGQLAALQSYRWIRYQPGKSQLVLVTGIMGTAAANVTRRMGLFSATNVGPTGTVTNGIYLEQTGASTINICITNAGTEADQIIAQANWNIDTFQGTGPSGRTLDLSKSVILVIDFQWLGLGRVRVGFDFNGIIYYAHEFRNAGSVTNVYMQTATLPIRYELITTSTAATMKAVCAAVVAEGGADDIAGYTFTKEFTGTALSGAQTHLGSIRPFVTFNGVGTRYPIIPLGIETIVTGTSPVLFEIVFGATYSSGISWPGNAFSTYSGVEVSSGTGVISSTPIIAASFYNGASSTQKFAAGKTLLDLYPLVLNAAGLNIAMGTLSIYATGIGGNSACRASIQWKEVR